MSLLLYFHFKCAAFRSKMQISAEIKTDQIQIQKSYRHVKILAGDFAVLCLPGHLSVKVSGSDN